MTAQTKYIRTLVIVIAVLALVIAPVTALAECDNEPDAPDCPCFNDTGAWNPSGPYIQDVALQTLGTRESCACPGTWGCDWEIDPNHDFTNAGKPYYQMVLGCNDETSALLASWAIADFGIEFHKREAWCSETISYWHRETGIPYSGGYSTGWHADWQIYNVRSLRLWYTGEDFVNDFGRGGRGRWIEPGEIDYDDVRLGVTVPVPGAYVAIRGYTYGAPGQRDSWHDFKNSHSLIINEMWIHEDVLGNVFQIEVTLLEGNSGNRVRDDHRYDDIWSVTPEGPDWIGSDRKIYGFGVDLDEDRQPVYDPARLHWEKHNFVAILPNDLPVLAKDPEWEQSAQVVTEVKAYARKLFDTGGPMVVASPQLKIEKLPDGNDITWLFDENPYEPLFVEIDLLEVHPLPIRSIQLTWQSESLPGGYRVQFAETEGKYIDAQVPDFGKSAAAGQSAPVPVPVPLSSSPTGERVRFLKLSFPKDTFQKPAVLRSLRFHYYQGPWEDSDDNPGVCFPEQYKAYQDWLALGRPSCWCAPPAGNGYQCDGDADGKTETAFDYRIYTLDLRNSKRRDKRYYRRYSNNNHNC